MSNIVPDPSWKNGPDDEDVAYDEAIDEADEQDYDGFDDYQTPAELEAAYAKGLDAYERRLRGRY